MIIGAQKCGTTNLAAQLATHPQICFCKVKEPGYFHQTENWQAGLADYHQLYAPAPGQLCGEASTFYTFFPDYRQTHTRLHAYNPKLKLIYIMRNPVERVISNYAHNVVRELEKAPPEVAVFRDSGYINRSRYGVQLRPYVELFGRDQILPLIFEEYIADQEATLRQVAAFLQIAPTGFSAVETVDQHKSVGEWYIKYAAIRDFAASDFFQRLRGLLPMGLRQAVKRRLSKKLATTPTFTPDLRAEIGRLLADDVQAVEALLGRPAMAWAKPATLHPTAHATAAALLHAYTNGGAAPAAVPTR
jgi:hypothetical protein